MSNQEKPLRDGIEYSFWAAAGTQANRQKGRGYSFDGLSPAKTDLGRDESYTDHPAVFSIPHFSSFTSIPSTTEGFPLTFGFSSGPSGHSASIPRSSINSDGGTIDQFVLLSEYSPVYQWRICSIFVPLLSIIHGACCQERVLLWKQSVGKKNEFRIVAMLIKLCYANKA